MLPRRGPQSRGTEWTWLWIRSIFVFNPSRVQSFETNSLYLGCPASSESHSLGKPQVFATWSGPRLTQVFDFCFTLYTALCKPPFKPVSARAGELMYFEAERTGSFPDSQVWPLDDGKGVSCSTLMDSTVFLGQPQFFLVQVTECEVCRHLGSCPTSCHSE